MEIRKTPRSSGLIRITSLLYFGTSYTAVYYSAAAIIKKLGSVFTSNLSCWKFCVLQTHFFWPGDFHESWFKDAGMGLKPPALFFFFLKLIVTTVVNAIAKEKNQKAFQKYFGCPLLFIF